VKLRASVVPVMHRDSAVSGIVRRGMPRGSVRVLMCRSPERLHDFLDHELVDAIVVDVRREGTAFAAGLIESYPGIPVFAMSSFRPDDGELLARCGSEGFRGPLLVGVDNAVAGEVIASASAGRQRRAALSGGPRLLRLTEPIQLEAWEWVLAGVGEPTRTSDIAAALGVTREHLSREFAAGGAPNLKRLIDLVRAAWAADLLRNPGYDVRTVSRLLRYSSSSHMAGSVRRVAGVSPSDLAKIGPTGVLRRFVKGRMRSRL
jgi:AraC-like DNA-binding protein